MTKIVRRKLEKPVTVMTRGEKVLAFIHEYCRVPEGKNVGRRIVLDPFQRKFILDVYDNPVPTSLAILSIARKNGKTALIACIALAHIVGPEAVLNSQIISGARSREQAGIVYKYISKMIALEPRLQEVTRTVPSVKKVLGLRKNVEYQAISAEAKTAHGNSPIVAILDEVGQVRGPQDDFVDAIETAQGAYDTPLLFAISTQAANDADLFSQWIDDAKSSGDPALVCHVYEAPAGCDLMDREAWRSSNPGLGEFRSTADLEKLAKKAARMPSFAATFRNLNLNQRVETLQPFVSRDVWVKNEGAPAPIEGKRVFGGLDLASVHDLAALVLSTEEGDMHCTFWTPAEGIRERSKEARAPFDVWADQGYIVATPGASIQYEHIAHQLRTVFDLCDVVKIGFDRYNMKFLRPWLLKAGFTEQEIEDKFESFGQGFVSMGPALREFESKLLNGKLRTGGNPVLRMCAANARVDTDAAENRKFVKRKSSGRIDGMVAAAMCIGVMPAAAEETGPSFWETAAA